MKKMAVFILLFLGRMHVFADAANETLMLENQKTRLLLDKKLRESAELQEEAKKLRLEQKNLKLTILQMESVLANIKNPAVPVLTPTVIKAGSETTPVLEMTLKHLAEFKGRTPPDSHFAQIAAAKDGENALIISVTDLEKQKNAVVAISLPKEKVAGKKIVCSVRVKGENISQSGNPGMGSKFGLMVPRPEKTEWPSASIGSGHFDWKEITFSPSIPFDAKQCMLLLGLQGVTGVIYFRDLKIVAVGD